MQDSLRMELLKITLLLEHWFQIVIINWNEVVCALLIPISNTG